MNLFNRAAMTLAATLTLMTWSVAAQAPSAGGAGAPPQPTASGAPSVLMAVELSKSLDSKKAKTGDQVEAKTMQDMKAPNGTDIPSGSKVVGHVTRASAHTKEQPQAQLGVVFEKIVAKSGQEFPFRGVMQAVSVPENAPPNAGGGFGPGNVGAQQQGGQAGGGQQPGMTGQAGSQSERQGATSGASGAQGPGSDANPTSAASPATPATSGVTGLKDVQLAPGAEPALSSSSHNIHLDSGSVITLKVVPTPQR